jgi:hypothetical protein
MSIDLVAFGPNAEMLAFAEAVEVSTLATARKLAEELRDRTKADKVFAYNYRNGAMWFSLTWDDKMNMGMVPVA